MKVLVIDDMQKNQESARATIVGHELTVAGNVEESFRILKEEGKTFGAVLTDLWMPGPSGREAFGVGQVKNYQRVPMPSGMLFALMAVNCGVDIVAIVTDMSHHCDQYTAGLEGLRVGNRVLLRDGQMHHVPGDENAKDWGEILKNIILYVPKEEE